jgi:Uma2 family endonuclease
VRTPSARNFQPEPDVVVLPGIAGYDLYSENFRLLAEVLSPSNARMEIDLKLRRYCEAPENLYAVVIEPRELLVEIYGRRNNWQPVKLTKADDPIEMPELGLRCQVVDLYRGTVLDPKRGRFS